MEDLGEETDEEEGGDERGDGGPSTGDGGGEGVDASEVKNSTQNNDGVDVAGVKGQQVREPKRTSLGTIAKVLGDGMKGMSQTMRDCEKDKRDHDERMLKFKLDEETKRMDMYLRFQLDIAKILGKPQNVGLNSYIHPYRTDKDDLVCHGEGSQILFSPWISKEKKLWVYNLLQRGFASQQVLDGHIKALHQQLNIDSRHGTSRDDFLSIRDILNIARKIAIDTIHLHEDDAKSTRRWCLDNEAMVFIYQEQDLTHKREFILGIQSAWQKEICKMYSDGNLLAMDATFGTNKCTFHLYTILVFDAYRNGIPIAWVLTSSAMLEVTCLWLSRLRDSM
ncbi:hypothetical protein L7F22_044446 [Adiantum nelumboides]|nr:hypothetical protein [Adiantum nelumboides]